MGWNSWNWHGKQAINEQVVLETIDAIVSEGLKKAGYVYVVVDGGWRDTVLNEDGSLRAHPEKFPNGMKYLADYAHLHGLKFGLHVVPGTHDCGGDPVGGYGKEEVHINQFVEWGLDLIKLDLCTQKNDPCDACVKGRNGWSEKTIKESYEKWSRLLTEAPREILLSISAYQYRDWYPEICNMARTTGDIRGKIHGRAYFNPPDSVRHSFFSIMDIAISNNLSAEDAGNGYWNDPDMMVTGEQGLTKAEQESHFALWCIMSSPLILGNDPRNMTSFEKQLILNREMIMVNQDPSEQGRLIIQSPGYQVWMKKLRDNSVAVLFINLDRSKEKELSLALETIGIAKNKMVRDLIEGKDLDAVRDAISLTAGPHQCNFLLISEDTNTYLARNK